MSKYNIITDPKYNFLRIDPIPSQEEVDKFYLEEFYASNYGFNDSSLEVQQKDDFFKNRFEDIFRHLVRLKNNLSGQSVFDIGFGFAQALLFFKNKGLDVSGIEPSKEGYEYALKNNIEAYQGNIEDFSVVGNNRYDIITLLNVLEHLRNPAQTLLNIKTQLIKKDGILIIDVPNEYNDFQVIANQEYSLKEWWLCPPNHINYFSATSLENLLTDCGYKVIYKEASFPLELFMLMGDIYVGNQELGSKCHQRRVLFESLMRKYGRENKLSALYEAFAKLDLGRQIMIYASPII